LGQIVDQQFSGDGNTTIFTLTQDATSSSAFVYINGVGQLPGAAYSITGNVGNANAVSTITFNQAPLSGDTVDIRFVSYVTTVELITNDWGNSWVQVTDTPAINFVVAAANAATITSQGVFQVQGPSLQLPSYTVSQASNISTPVAGQVIFVSDGNSGQPSLAVYDGNSWKRVALGATISAT
jgi:hypothetical protein